MKLLNVVTGTAIVLVVFLSGCATTPKPATPPAVFEMDPMTHCDREPQADGWPIKAQLMEFEDGAYLALYLDPGYDLVREPNIRLRAGFAIYEGHRGATYFYRLGKIPKTIRLGTISFKGVNRMRVGNRMRDEYIFFRMERRGDTDCLRLIHISK